MKCRPCDIPMEPRGGRYACPCCGRAVVLRDPAIEPALPPLPPVLRVEERGWEQDESVSKHASTYPARVCIGAGCGLSFVPRAPNQKRCLECAAEIATRRKSLAVRVCIDCEEPYAPNAGMQKRCSPCAVKDRRKDVTGARMTANRLTAPLRRAS